MEVGGEWRWVVDGGGRDSLRLAQASWENLLPWSGGLGRVALDSGWGGVFQPPCLSPQLPGCVMGTGSPSSCRATSTVAPLLGHRAVYRMCLRWRPSSSFLFAHDLRAQQSRPQGCHPERVRRGPTCTPEALPAVVPHPLPVSRPTRLRSCRPGGRSTEISSLSSTHFSDEEMKPRKDNTCLWFHNLVSVVGARTQVAILTLIGPSLCPSGLFKARTDSLCPSDHQKVPTISPSTCPVGMGFWGGQLLSPTQLSSVTCPFLHHRFWFFKFLIFIGHHCGRLLHPDGSFSNSRWPWWGGMGATKRTKHWWNAAVCTQETGLWCLATWPLGNSGG